MKHPAVATDVFKAVFHNDIVYVVCLDKHSPPDPLTSRGKSSPSGSSAGCSARVFSRVLFGKPPGRGRPAHVG